jgi:hypothetical protein
LLNALHGGVQVLHSLEGIRGHMLGQPCLDQARVNARGV